MVSHITVDYYESMKTTHWDPGFNELAQLLARRLLVSAYSRTKLLADNWAIAKLVRTQSTNQVDLKETMVVSSSFQLNSSTNELLEVLGFKANNNVTGDFQTTSVVRNDNNWFKNSLFLTALILVQPPLIATPDNPFTSQLIPPSERKSSFNPLSNSLVNIPIIHPHLSKLSHLNGLPKMYSLINPIKYVPSWGGTQLLSSQYEHNNVLCNNHMFKPSLSYPTIQQNVATNTMILPNIRSRLVNMSDVLKISQTSEIQPQLLIHDMSNEICVPLFGGSVNVDPNQSLITSWTLNQVSHMSLQSPQTFHCLEVLITKDEAKTRFVCTPCSKQWTSMKGSISFVVILSSFPNGTIRLGQWIIKPGANVFFELFSQACGNCGLLCQPKWYPEEIKKASVE